MNHIFYIQIDTREPKNIINNLIKQYEDTKNIEVKCCNCDIGDYIIGLNNKPMIIIERKTYTDYEASLKDGRKNEQFSRIISSDIPKHGIYYLLEGNISDIKNVGIKKSVMSSIKNKRIRDKINILFSDNKEHTIKILENYISFLKNHTYFWNVDKDEYNSISAKGGEYMIKLSNYQNNIQIKKSKNKTKSNTYLSMLRQIHGVSLTVAIAIQNQFGTMNLLISGLNLNKTALLGLRVSDKRKIGKVISERIYDILI